MAGLAQIRSTSQSAVCGSQMPQSKGVLWLQYITIGLDAGGVRYCAGCSAAHSVTVLAFGSDSLVELLSAVVVVLQFGKRVSIERATAARLAGVLLFVLAGVVGVLAVAAFVERVPPEPSVLGVVVAGVALIAMPLLAWRKRKKAAEMGDLALAADAVQSATCAYLAAATLISLGLQLFFPVRWIDSAAALAVLPILIIEGRNAMGGAACGCCQ